VPNNYFIFQNPLLAIKKSFMKFRQQIYAPSLASCCSNSKTFFNTRDETPLPFATFFFSIYFMKTWGRNNK